VRRIIVDFVISDYRFDFLRNKRGAAIEIPWVGQWWRRLKGILRSALDDRAERGLVIAL